VIGIQDCIPFAGHQQGVKIGLVRLGCRQGARWPIALPHVKAGGWAVLTVPTSELQTFILKYGEDKKAFKSRDQRGKGKPEA